MVHGRILGGSWSNGWIGSKQKYIKVLFIVLKPERDSTAVIKSERGSAAVIKLERGSTAVIKPERGSAAVPRQERGTTASKMLATTIPE